MEQVLLNLAVNARDAMPRGGTLIMETANVGLDEAYASSHPGVKPGAYVRLAITDTGCGMSKEILDHIFEPFFTTKERGKGTGLGLSTVYGIVKQSGGNIFVYSEPERGTTFKIYLPATEGEAQPVASTPGEVRTVGRGEHILVVEDDESLRTMMAGLLAELGYKVTPAANAGEALLLVEEVGLNPDLIITDVVMPNMSGKQLVDRLQRTRPDLKVLYMSGYTDNAIVHYGILDPGTPFIQKPFTRDVLGMKIRELLATDRAEPLCGTPRTP
jgi:CheY-like chemotaxis protein